MTDKLKLCPFCGGEAVWWDTGDHKYPYQIVCRSCFCETNETQTRSSAIEAWNTRMPMDRIAEKLEEEVTEIGSRVCNNTKCNHECVDDAGMCDHGVLMGAIINAIREGVQNE